jgi:hypothetical protein
VGAALRGSPRHGRKKEKAMTNKILALALCLLVPLAGCSPLRPRSPKVLASYTAEANTGFVPGWLLAYNMLPDAAKQGARNSLLLRGVWLVDINYGKFEVAYYANKAAEDILGDVAVVLLGGSTVFTVSSHAKTVISVVTGAVTGVKASVDAHWYDSQTRDAVVKEMQALRSTQLAAITTGMAQPPSVYTMEQGMLDIQAYYQAGSISSALQAINQAANSDNAAGKAALDKARHPKQ